MEKGRGKGRRREGKGRDVWTGLYQAAGDDREQSIEGVHGRGGDGHAARFVSRLLRGVEGEDVADLNEQVASPFEGRVGMQLLTQADKTEVARRVTFDGGSNVSRGDSV